MFCGWHVASFLDFLSVKVTLTYVFFVDKELAI